MCTHRVLHDTRLHVMSKEVESTIEYLCKIGACMEETHDQVGVRKQLKCKRLSQKYYTGLIQRWGDINMQLSKVSLSYYMSV